LLAAKVVLAALARGGVPALAIAPADMPPLAAAHDRHSCLPAVASAIAGTRRRSHHPCSPVVIARTHRRAPVLARPPSSHAPTVVLATTRARCPRSPRRLLPPVAPTVRARLPSTLACRLLPPVVPTARAHPPSAFARHRARRPHPRAAHTRPPSHSPTAYARLRLAHLFLLPRRSVRVREGREQIGSMR
jgi:hypothetical protein